MQFCIVGDIDKPLRRKVEQIVLAIIKVDDPAALAAVAFL
jgi:hypothetical protein